MIQNKPTIPGTRYKYIPEGDIVEFVEFQERGDPKGCCCYYCNVLRSSFKKEFQQNLWGFFYFEQWEKLKNQNKPEEIL